jgi:acyl carrier protein
MDKEAGEIEEAVRNYLLREVLVGEDPAKLTDAVALQSSGILDSIAVVKLVSFLDEKFEIEIESVEVDDENFETIASIAALVRAKLAARRDS